LEDKEIIVAQVLDFSAVWNDTLAALRRHREAIVAIAGILIFVPNWASAFFVPPPDVEGLTSIGQILAAQTTNFEENWKIIVPLGLLSFFGGIAVLTLLLRADMERVGDALLFAVKLLPVYFLTALLAGFLTGLGAFALFIGLFYVSGRLMTVGPIVVAEPDHGIFGSIQRAWELSRGSGWNCLMLFLIVMIVAFILTGVIDLIVGMVCLLIGGPDGVPLVQSLFNALSGSILAVVILALQSSLYRHLQQQAALRR
jgi:hypothetical protein